MKYKVRVQRWENVCREIYIEVEASGHSIAEKAALNAAACVPQEMWGPMKEGHDVKHERFETLRNYEKPKVDCPVLSVAILPVGKEGDEK